MQIIVPEHMLTGLEKLSSVHSNCVTVNNFIKFSQ